MAENECNCGEAKVSLIELNRRGLSNYVDVVCKRCNKVWSVKDL